MLNSQKVNVKSSTEKMLLMSHEIQIIHDSLRCIRDPFAIFSEPLAIS